MIVKTINLSQGTTSTFRLLLTSSIMNSCSNSFFICGLFFGSIIKHFFIKSFIAEFSDLISSTKSIFYTFSQRNIPFFLKNSFFLGLFFTICNGILPNNSSIKYK